MTAITKCRICGSEDLQEVMSLGNMSLTGIFPRPDINVAKSPLDLVRCVGGCGLVQLLNTYNLAEMYGMDYGYRSGLNAGMVKHLHELIGQHFSSLNKGDLVVDIGSNDGTSLAAYPEWVRRVGIDPTGVKFKQFYNPGIELISDFFSAAKLRELVGDKKAKVVTSFSMFYDLEDPQSFMNEIAGILDDKGVWTMEQSYLPAMLKANAYDTICQEHLLYYSLRQIDYMAKRAGLEVIRAYETPTNGGSFVVKLCLTGKGVEADPGVEAMRAKELTLGLQEPYAYEAFKYRSFANTDALMKLLVLAKMQGKTVYGLGASTKGNVLLQSIAGVKNLITKIGDINSDKWGCVTPGTQIPIVPEDEVLAENPDFLVVLPWHFRNGFVNNLKFKGRRLVFPLPQLEIVTP